MIIDDDDDDDDDQDDYDDDDNDGWKGPLIIIITEQQKTVLFSTWLHVYLACMFYHLVRASHQLDTHKNVQQYSTGINDCSPR